MAAPTSQDPAMPGEYPSYMYYDDEQTRDETEVYQKAHDSHRNVVQDKSSPIPKDESAEVQEALDYQYFLTHVAPKDYQKGEAILDKVQLQDEVFTRLKRRHLLYLDENKNLVLPFFPRTNKGAAAFPDFKKSTSITREQFLELAKKNPDAMFEEFRTRELSVAAAHAVLLDVNTLLTQATENADTFVTWVHKFGKDAEDLTKQLAEQSAKVEELQHLEEAFDALTDEKRDLEEDVLRLTRQQTMASTETAPALPKGVQQSPTSSVSSSSLPGPRVTFDIPPPKFATDPKPVPVPVPKRSAKAADPPTFTNDRPTADKPEVKFKQWYLLLKAKLAKNADHFDSEEDKIAYILSRMSGSASEALISFVYADPGCEPMLRTCDAVLNHLYSQYHDPNEYETARVKYRDLTMANSETFTEFKIQFARWASQARISPNDFKRDMHDKLPSRLNVNLVREVNDTATSFEQYCDMAQKFDYQQQKNFINTRNEREKRAPVTPSTTSRRPFSTSRPARSFPPRTSLGATPWSTPTISGGEHHGIRTYGNARDGHTLFARPNTEQLKLLAAKGQCFICHEKQHMSRDCPYKAEYDSLRNTRLQATVARMTHDEPVEEELKDAAQDN